MNPLAATDQDDRPRSRPAVIQPLHDGYDDARQAWNLAVDQRPEGVIHARTVADVIGAVALADELGLKVAPQGTGHMAGALPSLENTLLLRTELSRGVRVDPATRRARVNAGCVWQDVVDAV